MGQAEQIIDMPERAIGLLVVGRGVDRDEIAFLRINRSERSTDQRYDNNDDRDFDRGEEVPYPVNP